MAEYDDFDDDFDDNDGGNDSGPAGLREALKKAKQELKKAKEENATLTKNLAEANQKVKSTTLTELLKEAGASEKLAAKLDKEGVEPTKEAVADWIKDNRDLYNPALFSDQNGDQPNGAEGDAGDNVPDDLRDGVQRGQRSSEVAGQTGDQGAPPEEQLAALNPGDFKSAEELKAAIEKIRAATGG